MNSAETSKPPSAGSNRESLARSLMVNLVIPIALLCGAGLVVFLLGTVEPEKLPDLDNSRTGRLRSLPPVRVATIQSLESTGEQLRLEVDGTVVPYQEARVAAEVAGRVVFKSDTCEAGSIVKKGDLLMRIDATDYQLEVQRLARLKQQEYESLGEVDQEIVNTNRLIEVGKEDVALQQKEVERLESLPKDFASRAEIDRAKRALLASRQQLVSTQNQLDLLQKRRTKLESSEQLAATQLRAAEVNLARTEIVAPIDGVIVSEQADLNSFVARGSVLITIEDTSKVEVRSNLRMDQLHWVLNQGGVSETLSNYDLPDTPANILFDISGRDGVTYRWRGRLLSYDGIGVDTATRTVPVRVIVDDPSTYIDEDGSERPVGGASSLVRGMFVRVQLLLKPQRGLVVIPARALRPGNRVFEFLPDESVLELKKAVATDKEDAATRDLSGTEGSDDEGAEEESNFDPNQWQPGRLVLRSSIRPVDSLSIEDPGDLLKDLGNSSDRKHWVCEVEAQQLAGGSLVVVSPIGNVDRDPFPVRADRQGMSQPQTKTASPSSEPAGAKRSLSRRENEEAREDA